MAIDVCSPDESLKRAAPMGPVRIVAIATFAMLLAASTGNAQSTAAQVMPERQAARQGDADSLAQVDPILTEQYAMQSPNVQSRTLLGTTATADASAGMAAPRGRLHRSLLLEVQAVPGRPLAPTPLAPISPDPGADVIPLPAPFIGGAAVLACLVATRYWRR